MVQSPNDESRAALLAAMCGIGMVPKVAREICAERPDLTVEAFNALAAQYRSSGAGAVVLALRARREVKILPRQDTLEETALAH